MSPLDDESLVRLLRQLRLAPNDEALRMELAAALTGRGDPWGESIVLAQKLSAALKDGPNLRARELFNQLRKQTRWHWPNERFRVSAGLGFPFEIIVQDLAIREAQARELELVGRLWFQDATTDGLHALRTWLRLPSIKDLEIERWAQRTGSEPAMTAAQQAERRAALAAALERAYLHHLTLVEIDLEGSDLRRLLATPQWSMLQTLSLRNCGVHERVSGGDWPRLTALALVECSLTEDDLVAIVATGSLRGLRSLDLGGSSVGDAAAAALASAGMAELDTLALQRSALSRRGIHALADAGVLSSLRAFRHSWTMPPDPRGRDRALGLIAEGCTSATELELCPRDELDIEQLVQNLRAPVRRLSFFGAKTATMRRELLEILLQNPCLAGVRELVLRPSDDAVVAFARAQLPALDWLELGRVRKAGAHALIASALPRGLTLTVTGDHTDEMKNALRERFHSVRYREG